ncbi:MAG: serine acetyltransferase [Deltaproteobacteria bacterium]|jgi:serine O-acetyltransferase|nr:serine acetyltransferase [Deltaproteobacteria bacterium]
MSNKIDAPINDIVTAIVASYRQDEYLIKVDAKNQISKESIIDILERLRSLIYIGFFTQKPLKFDSIEYYVGEQVEDLAYNLQKQIRLALRHRNPEGDWAKEAAWVTRQFLSRLPAIRSILATDVEASYEGDPAASDKDEIILSYPGIHAITVNRLAHELYLLGVPLIPRMMTEHAHSLTGIDIHPGATIGHHFFIDHGTGLVIGETTVIGNYVKIYQGVTLGALSTRGGHLLDGVKRHPTIESHVTIYAGASILGGSTIIGEGVVIGSNAFITTSIPERTKVSVKNTDLRLMTDKSQADAEFLQDEFWDYSI